MAKRRSLLQKIAGGLGEGITNASSVYMRQRLQEKMMDRADDRAEARDERTAKRQGDAATQKELDDILDSIIKGDLDSPQGAKRIGLRTGKEPPLDTLDALRPGPARRLDKRFGQEITSATSAERLPQEGDITAFARSDRMEVPGQIGFRMTEPEGFEGMEPDPVGSFDPAVRAMAGNVGARRRGFEDAPTERVEVEGPTGSKTVQMMSKASLRDPLQVSPDAKTRGALKGQEKVGELGESSDALLAQALAEYQGKQDIDLSPKASGARVGEAGRKRAAELAAELAQGGFTPQQQTAALQLADDFNMQSKDFYAQQSGFRNIATMAKRIEDARAVGDDSPASHIGMVFNFMKMQDPASTVREGEQAQAANAGGVSDRVRNLYNKLLLGGRLSPEQVTDFMKTSAALYNAAAIDHKSRMKDFSDRATQLRVPPTLVIREPAADMMSASAGSGTDKLRQR